MRDLDLCDVGMYSTYHKSCPVFSLSRLISHHVVEKYDLVEWINLKHWACDPPTQLLLPRELL